MNWQNIINYWREGFFISYSRCSGHLITCVDNLAAIRQLLLTRRACDLLAGSPATTSGKLVVVQKLEKIATTRQIVR